VGGGPDEQRIRDQIQSLGLAESVVLTGRVPHSDVQSYYRLVDVFVYPRVSMRLTELVTPLKPLEALAQGILVVASDVGGHRELIRHGENGYLFEAGSSSALAGTLVEALQNRESWVSLQSAGRKYVEHDRNWANSVRRYQAVYGSLL
jgi:glycosyltransferase involved in cell wall biosynthesis